ncbi:MAG: hypothetical protein H6799_00460 [Candidatus Nomurabacteria bacterium]|nr:MAG: hypothetical protein H6799_00460 [Candidatus Nomurabacteria bacterium]HRV75981.1 hypothetical protein [Candidatus Saccharimonadales bacterium]
MKFTKNLSLDSFPTVSSIKDTDSSEFKAKLKKATSRSNWINYIVIFFSIYFVWNTGVAIRHNQKLQTKLETLQNKAQLLEEANKNLALQKNYYSSKEYQEKALKENFNLAANGEKVLIIKDLPAPKDKSNNIFSELQELRRLINQ